MAKPFAEHDWQLTISAGRVSFEAKEMCRGPFHEQSCAVTAAEAKWRREHTHTATKAEKIETDMGPVTLFSGDTWIYGPEPDWPDCTCAIPPGEPCCCWDMDDFSECLDVTFDVISADYHYSYDAYSGEVDAWCEIKEAKVI